MLVVFPVDGDDMMFMTKRLPNSQVISKRHKHPNLYNTDNTEWITSAPQNQNPQPYRHAGSGGGWERARFTPEGCRPHFTATNIRALSGLDVTSKPRPRSVRNKTVPFRRVQNRLLISRPLLSDTSIDSVLYY